MLSYHMDIPMAGTFLMWCHGTGWLVFRQTTSQAYTAHLKNTWRVSLSHRAIFPTTVPSKSGSIRTNWNSLKTKCGQGC